MKQIIIHNLTKILVTIVALVLASASVFSMATMNHGPDNAGTCMIGMTEHAGCTSPMQTGACIEFHFSLLEKFSHGVASNVGFKFFSTLTAVGFLLFASNSLLKLFQYKANLLKVRLRHLQDDTISVFRDNFGYWLTIFEKRDPSFAFAMA